jgi:hypothetical protein
MAKNNLDLVAVQEVTWVGYGSQPEDNYMFSYGNGKACHQLGMCYFVRKGIISAVKRVAFINNKMSYITLGGRWCGIIVLNVHAPTEDKSDNMKEIFYKELQHVFNQFLKYYTKIPLRDFNANIERAMIFSNQQ